MEHDPMQFLVPMVTQGNDDELDVLAGCIHLIEGLPLDNRERVVMYLANKYLQDDPDAH